ncbi:MAG: HlyD family type I secretion periplasmic adaptor subunit [Rhodospirillales bacterium]|jgi:adhesin transport system membrane fusion protein|nr:HlyD family type I secretion periplasmic adaptor subunit [Pseudomonadota bacterium]MBT8003515.1 HlyD family type I secretion periplasmic adaptor subunit [Rhodospirillales bacterium]
MNKETKISPVESLLDKYSPKHGSHLPILVILILMSTFSWMFVSELDEVAVATGQVVPQGQVKLIQHLEGGIVTEILAKEGQKVGKGERLMQLRLGADRVRSSEIELQAASLVIKRDRLQAELDKQPFSLPENVDVKIRKIFQKEILTFDNRKRQVNGSIKILEANARQKILEIKELESRIKGRKTSLEFALKRLQISKSLEKDNLTTKMEVLDLENEYGQLKSEIAELQTSLQRAKEAHTEARQRATSLTLDFNREVSEELGRVEIALAQTEEQLKTASELVDQTALYSPIEGIVKNLRQHTIGGVVQPGEAIMEVVPAQDTLVVETKLSPIDVGYVRVGQKADVKILTYDFLRYGSLPGLVKNVAADTSTDLRGDPYFRVEIETERNYLGKDLGSLPITPGMQAEINIKTGTRSVFNFLISPVFKTWHAAFKER